MTTHGDHRRAEAPESIPEAATPARGVHQARQLPLEPLAVLILAGIVLAAVYPLVSGGVTAGVDNLNFFYPMFAFLGEELRHGNIPGWNPYQFAGTPFAADPESGWTYLPAMLLFTALPLASAAPALMLFHVLLAALSIYALARLLGLAILGALVAAVGFAISGFFLGQSVCCPAYIFVSAWIPLLLLSVHLACAAPTWLARVWWWAVGGLALSQVLAMWLGQGSYYALLLLGSFTLYRTLLAPDLSATPLPRRVGWLALHLAAVLAWAVGFAAAGVLPRVELVNLSNLAAGYRGSAPQDLPSLIDVLGVLVRPAYIYYAGASVLALALAAFWLARRWFALPYFAAVAIGALILAADIVTPLHALLFALFPRFEDLHSHAPIRIMLLVYPAVALLAGAAVGAIRKRPIVAMLLLAVVVVDLVILGQFRPGIIGRHQDLTAYYDGKGAAAFLATQQGSGPWRYFGYDPAASVDWYGGEVMQYIWNLFDPQVAALLVNNRATLLRLEDIQGYNPLHLQRFGDYIDALNGEPQEYHGRNILPSGLHSPLLDLLNARFVVIPADGARGRPDLALLVADHPVVYRDDLVMVLENRDALPRAWIVHEARQVAPGDALPLLASGAVDPRQTALLESEPPSLAPASDPSRDHAAVQLHAPDAMRVLTRTDAPGLLVLSEIAYPAWQAYVDGKPAPLYVANHALRAVPLPAGEHTVELRYESAALRIGLVISLLTLLAFGGVAAAVAARAVRGWTGPGKSFGIRVNSPVIRQPVQKAPLSRVPRAGRPLGGGVGG